MTKMVISDFLYRILHKIYEGEGEGLGPPGRLLAR